MNRGSNKQDKLCELCDDPMIGIMKCSDAPGYTAPRKICDKCEELEKTAA